MNKAEKSTSVHTPKILVICNRQDTAAIWGYAIRQKGLSVVMENSHLHALDRYVAEMPDLVVIDLDARQAEIVELYRNVRALSAAPILLFLPAHDETQITEAYDAGVDDVIVKPVSPAIFVAKVTAWARRSWTMPMEGLSLLSAGRHRLDPTRRCLKIHNGLEIKLTNLEYRLLHLLMSRPGHVFNAEEIVESIWGGYGNGDHIMLKNVVYRLRKKIEEDRSHPTVIQTWQGGYSFTD